MKKLLFLLAIAVAVTSCGITYSTAYQNAQVRVANVTTYAAQRPLMVDVRVLEPQTKITDVWTVTEDKFVNEFRSDINSLRAWGAAQSVKKHKCDVLVAPLFDVVKSATSTSYEITVTGFPAVLENWANATVEEMNYLNNGSSIILANPAPAAPAQGQESKQQTIGGLFGL